MRNTSQQFQSIRHNSNRRRRLYFGSSQPGLRQHDRAGSVLLVVIGLLGMLLLVGVAFYSFAGQEQIASQNYSDAAKVDDSGLSADTLWAFALEQLIVGTSDGNRQHSALWGQRHSLLAGVLGRNSANTDFDGFDLTPFNGKGINVQYTAAGDPFVDQNFDGTDDVSPALLNINLSAAANGGAVGTPPSFAEPDVDYTAPDINSLALSFVGYGVDQNGADVKVIIPSFHRPQLLRKSGKPIVDWQTDIDTPLRVLRPHPEHRCVNSTLKRFSPSIPNALGQPVAPFPFGTSATLKQGVWDLQGTPSVTPIYQWDVDNDLDGDKEGIWLDLDFPVQTLSDGRKYVPLFSFTVTDADGLINLNIAGNQTGLASPTVPLANGGLVSRSNQGLSRSEISPEWAMLADPNSDSASTTQANLFWNTAAGSISRMEMANMETVFLNIGRPDFTQVNTGTYVVPGDGITYEPTAYYPGRYGELELMAGNNYTTSKNGMAGYGSGDVVMGLQVNRDFSLIPQPGRSNQIFGGSGDDDLDSQYGYSRFDNAGYFFMGMSFLRMQSNTPIPSFVHPLDFWGNGSNMMPGITGMKLQLSSSGLSVPTQWPAYWAGYSSPGTDSTGSGFLNYLNAGSGNLISPTVHTGQSDEPDEIIAEWELATTNPTMQQDDIFGPDNMFELHATDVDLTKATLQARVRDLAPFNFKLAQRAETIRHQYTVLSHDRKNFGLSPFTRRQNEFSADSDNDGAKEFPPAFPALMSGVDPIRPALRQLLYVEQNQSTAMNTLGQLRLNINRLLTSYDTTNGPVVSSGTIGVPVYRELTAHPGPGVVLANTPISGSSWNPDSPGGTPTAADQEWWARLDRQHLARDIYVLLYMLGGGQDTASYASSNAGGALYSKEQLREMAQFAVNFVDELDRDDVITKFEYDRDLSDGWNVTDNAYDTVDDPTAVVYGVEAQKLTLSEVLGIVSKKVLDGSNGIDHPSTQVNDADGDRYYTYIELRNASPFQVDLLNGAWQIAVQRGNGTGMDGIPNSSDDSDVVQLTPYRSSKSATSTIAPGALFTIGTRGGPAQIDPSDSSRNLPSIFRVDTTGKMAPDFSDAAPTPTVIAPQTSNSLDLDLIPQTVGSTNINTQFRISDATSILGSGANVTAAGNFLYGPDGMATGNVLNTVDPLTFILRRRANLTRTMPVVYDIPSATAHVSQSQDNPWVEVDRITMNWKEFQLLKDSSGADEMARAATVQAQLKDSKSLTSRERAQPFSRNLQENVHPAVGAAPYQAHTVGGLNSNSPSSFTQVQLHFDRDFASPIDLLALPLYGPDEVTRRVGQTSQFNRTYAVPTDVTLDTTAYLAQERFLRPMHIENLQQRLSQVPAQYPDAYTAATSPATLIGPDPLNPLEQTIKNNRWYRILELLEVPTQTEQNMRVYPYTLRGSGAINLNMVRTRGVLAGLIDDPDNPSSTATIDGHLNPAYGSEAMMLVDNYEPGPGGTTRDWWYQFLLSRDGIDPITKLVLPGTPQARPFRSLLFAERNSASLDDTVLRSLPLDMLSAIQLTNFSDRRSLFEARAKNDRPSFGGGDGVDPLSKHRLARKVANNSTTRSNVFAVWITTRFFEAVEVPNTGEIQIGDVLKGTEDHRGFFVIDRSLPEVGYDSNTGKFNYNKFVQYRKTLQ